MEAPNNKRNTPSYINSFYRANNIPGGLIPAFVNMSPSQNKQNVPTTPRNPASASASHCISPLWQRKAKYGAPCPSPRATPPCKLESEASANTPPSMPQNMALPQIEHKQSAVLPSTPPTPKHTLLGVCQHALFPSDEWNKQYQGTRLELKQQLDILPPSPFVQAVSFVNGNFATRNDQYPLEESKVACYTDLATRVTAGIMPNYMAHLHASMDWIATGIRGKGSPVEATVGATFNFIGAFFNAINASNGRKSGQSTNGCASPRP